MHLQNLTYWKIHQRACRPLPSEPTINQVNTYHQRARDLLHHTRTFLGTQIGSRRHGLQWLRALWELGPTFFALPTFRTDSCTSRSVASRSIDIPNGCDVEMEEV